MRRQNRHILLIMDNCNIQTYFIAYFVASNYHILFPASLLHLNVQKKVHFNNFCKQNHAKLHKLPHLRNQLRSANAGRQCSPVQNAFGPHWRIRESNIVTRIFGLLSVKTPMQNFSQFQLSRCHLCFHSHCNHRAFQCMTPCHMNVSGFALLTTLTQAI